jgi:hypothetical protein
MLKPTVIQEHGLGCGRACVAFTLGRSYAALSAELTDAQARTVGFSHRELVRALAAHNRSYSSYYLKPPKRRLIYREGVIVFIKRSKHYPHGHYLVRHHGAWMDPWFNSRDGEGIGVAISGYRRRLPGRPIYGIFPE